MRSQDIPHIIEPTRFLDAQQQTRAILEGMDLHLQELAKRGYLDPLSIPDASGSELDTIKCDIVAHWVWQANDPLACQGITVNMLAPSIVASVNSYIRELEKRGYVCLDGLCDFSGSEFNTWKWGNAEKVARCWVNTPNQPNN